VRLIATGIILAVILYFGVRWAAPQFAKLSSFRDEALLLAAAIAGGIAYLVLIFVLLGRGWLRGLLKTAEPAPKA
jgi:hypothetical protein